MILRVMQKPASARSRGDSGTSRIADRSVSLPVDLPVVRGGHGDKVLDAVVVLDSVDVMDDFLGSEKPTVSLFPNNAMFANVAFPGASDDGLSMVRSVDDGISTVHLTSGEAGTIATLWVWVVSSYVQMRKTSKGIWVSVSLRGNRRFLPASAQAESVSRIVCRGLYALAYLSESTSLGRLLGAKLMSWNEPLRAPLDGGSAKAFTAAALANRHVLLPLDGQAVMLIVADNQGGMMYEER